MGLGALPLRPLGSDGESRLGLDARELQLLESRAGKFFAGRRPHRMEADSRSRGTGPASRVNFSRSDCRRPIPETGGQRRRSGDERCARQSTSASADGTAFAQGQIPEGNLLSSQGAGLRSACCYPGGRRWRYAWNRAGGQCRRQGACAHEPGDSPGSRDAAFGNCF